MKSRKKLGLVIGIILTALVVLANSAPVPAVSVLKFSHTDQLMGKRQEAAEIFAKKVKEYTKGRYEVKIYPAGQLANDPKAIEQLMIGGIDFTVSATGSYAPIVDSLNLSMLPFLVDSYEQGWKLYDSSKWLQAQFDKAPAKGFRFLATWEAGFRCITTKDPLNSPKDAQGKKIRTFPNEIMRWTLEALVFSVQIMPLPEVYLAIQQGTVQGQENPIDTIHSNKFYEVAPYVTLTRHVYSPIPLTVSEMTWKRLSGADKKAVLKAAQEAAVFSRNEIKNIEARQLADMESNGAKIVKPNIGLFREAAKPVYDKARQKYGAAEVDAFLKDAEAVRKALPVK
jgi:tripartite ATP-independent transporter DctP family solute receptor